jgi:ubiquinone/menaquinone biosynthesis C-methylase UbiE
MTADELYQQAFRSEIAALKPVTLCDVGCGAGTLLTYARSLGITAAGIEPDAAKVADANGRGLDIRAGTAEALPFPDGTFDLVTFENSLHHVTEIGRALAEAMRVARRAVVIIDPWFDLSIPSQKVGDRFERWLKALDRMTGMVHWDPIAAGEIAGACNGSNVIVRHLLQLTPMSTEAFEYYAGRAQPHKETPVYKANGMDQELSAIRTAFQSTGITEAGALLMSVVK